jgi:hypothetical protein
MKKILLTTGLLFGLAFTANAQMTPTPNNPNQQQPGVQTPGTPPTFPTDRQDTAKDQQQSNQSDADSKTSGKDADKTDRDRMPQSDRTDQDRPSDQDRDEQYPQSTDRDQQNQQVQSGRDYDRDRQSGSVGSNAGQQDRERKDDLDTGMNPDRDHRSDYQSQLQKALQQNPNLAGVQVAYTDSTLELTGSVPTGKEKHEARMIAHDYANGRKVVDHITVTGKGQ